MATVDCLNCDQAMEVRGQSVFYCSDLCKQEAEYVRYARAVYADGRALHPDVQEALNIKLALILGGGYPATERRLSEILRQHVLERDRHACRACGQPGNQIDHINEVIEGDLNDLANLQVLCDRCHRNKTKDSFVTVNSKENPEEWLRLNVKVQALRARIRAPKATRLCDDEVRWKAEWRQLGARRRASAR
jgi:5-methylcytosine-specific restriction endonuclease McrA